MIVIRCYDVLGRPAIQLERHGHCCSTGTCHQPDKREHKHSDGISVGVLTTAECVVDLIHESLSDLGEDGLSEALGDHLSARKT